MALKITSATALKDDAEPAAAADGGLRYRGPWGQAIRHWLVVREKRQSDLVRATKMGSKAITSIVRGNHTTTRALTKIAHALNVPLADLFVTSPADQRRLIVDITESVLREIQARGLTPPSVEDAIEQFGQAVDAASPLRVERHGKRRNK